MKFLVEYCGEPYYFAFVDIYFDSQLRGQIYYLHERYIISKYKCDSKIFSQNLKQSGWVEIIKMHNLLNAITTILQNYYKRLWLNILLPISIPTKKYRSNLFVKKFV